MANILGRTPSSIGMRLGNFASVDPYHQGREVGVLKADITMFFTDDFSEENSQLLFLDNLNSKQEIENWVDKLTSRFVIKFDSEFENENDFIYDYLENG
ncbi:hypothetical protein [Flavobacterium sp. LB2R40]|uniref:hypothetical protein n=1 Tax=unclassified Flavobacterium TaxID=196869 RepID=UPI003AAF4966